MSPNCRAARPTTTPTAATAMSTSRSSPCLRRPEMVTSDATRVFPLELDRDYPVVVRGEGSWVEDSTGRRYLDAMSGGSMAATLGHGRRDLIDVARAQARDLTYVHNERLTNPLQERLADELIEVAPEGFSRVKFTVAGADAIEMAIQLA